MLSTISRIIELNICYIHSIFLDAFSVPLFFFNITLFNIFIMRTKHTFLVWTENQWYIFERSNSKDDSLHDADMSVGRPVGYWKKIVGRTLIDSHDMYINFESIRWHAFKNSYRINGIGGNEPIKCTGIAPCGPCLHDNKIPFMIAPTAFATWGP